MTLLGVALATFVLLSVLGASVYFLFFQPSRKSDNAPRRDAPAENARPERARRGRFRGRRRRAAEEEASSDDASDSEDEAEPDISDRQRRINAYEERRRERDAEREAQEEAEAAERLRKAEERRQQEEEEAAKWAEFITVEEQGEVETHNTEDLLNDFVRVVKERKIVVLEDLAIEFSLRTQDVIHRLEALEQTGRLTGVMDDRGKYLYISEEEMQQVAQYIVARGRVSLRDIAHVSHRLVDLEEKT